MPSGLLPIESWEHSPDVTVMKRMGILFFALIVVFSRAVPSGAQVPPPAPAIQLLAPADLDQLLGPIALYPDPLISELLPAATLPSQIVMADRYVGGGGDLNYLDQQPWDPSVRALARYPTVLKWMDDNLAWTTEVGQAFLAQQADVMDSIQRLRSQALALGNLQSTPQQVVEVDNGQIEILPANPQYIYVPVYQPQVVYYQRPFGHPFISFGLGFVIGSWLNHDLDWHHHDIIVWRHDNPRPPDWWRRPARERYSPTIINRTVNVWHPRSRTVESFPRRDRGYQNEPYRNEQRVEPRRVQPAPVTRQESRPVERHEAPTPPQVRRPEVRIEPPRVESGRSSGAVIGVQSARETHQYSARGQQSREVISHPAVSNRPAVAPSRSGPDRDRDNDNRDRRH